MCGLNGFTYQDSVLIDAMTQASLHRGSDYIGIYRSPEVTLAHNLLAIRGPASACEQPVHKPTSDWVLSFVGEIYNTDTIKQRHFPDLATNIDTHILWELIQKKGWDFIEDIHGMYAIALFNRREQILRLYRDPSGQKVIYFYEKAGELVFSSEITPLTRKKDADLSPDSDAISMGASLGYLAFDRTLFKHIRKLQMGEVLTWDIQARQSYRRIHIPTPASLPEKGTDREVLSKQIRSHFAADVPVALNLSGGMDSSALLQELVESELPFEAFTTHYELETESTQYNEEFELAQKLCAHYSVPHHGIRVGPKGYLDLFSKAYEAIEEPNYNVGNPTYLLTAMAEGAHGKGYRVVLSGDGGDEVFSGYPHHRRALQFDKLQRFLSPSILNLIMNRRHGLKNIDFSDPSSLWLHLRTFQASGPSADYIRKALLEFFPLFAPSTSIVQDMIHIDRILWVASENLIRSDKLFMQESIELRAPFCYHPLRMHFDQRLQLKDYVSREYSKKALREIYRGRLPDFITERKRKWGWRPPLAVWYDDKFKEKFLEVIDAGADPRSAIVPWKEIKEDIRTSSKVPSKRLMYFISLAAVAHKFGMRL